MSVGFPGNSSRLLVIAPALLGCGCIWSLRRNCYTSFYTRTSLSYDSYPLFHRCKPSCDEFRSLRHYSGRTFLSDAIAGVTVGFVALPLAMAFAISSGVSPQAGLYCAIVAGFLISFLGGSTTQIGGPTGAFVVVVYGIVARYGLDGLFMCTLMAGILLVILGATGLGTLVNFIPRPVVLGFTNGIAVLIASTQVKDFFGIRVENVPGEFFARMLVLGRNFHSLSPAATGLAVLALVMIVVFSRYVKRVPGYIVALFAGTILVALLKLPVETIGTRFGGIPSGLPTLRIPHFRVDLLRPLISPAITVAMLGAIESLMTAVVSDRMSGGKHNPNVELVGQGVANIFSPLFGGLPATGAIARTATNIRAGAKTPVAGMVHALTLLAIVVWAAPLARFIPLSVLAGDPVCGRLQHGRVAGNPRTSAPFPPGGGHLAHHLCADGIRRFDRCGGGRDDPGGVCVHPQSDRDNHRFSGDRRVPSRRARAYPAAQRDPVLCDDLPHSRTLPFRGYGQNRADHLPPFGVAAHHHPSPSQYDRDRRHRTSGFWRIWRMRCMPPGAN